jgi:hypothetical protein
MLNSLHRFQVLQPAPWRLSSRLQLIVNVTAVLLLVSAPFWLHELFGIYQEDTSIPLFDAAATVGLILIVNYVLILHSTRRHTALRQLMVVGFLAKVAAAGLYISMVVRLYNYGADMSHYFYAAQGYATNYQQVGMLTVPTPLFGSDFVPFLTECLLLVTGISMPVATVIFASMAFWGAYFIYRAFSIGFPEATRVDLVTTLVFLLPSCVFWTASISKDAVVMLGSGLATYGFARVHQHINLHGYFFLAAGLGVVMTVRPHMAGILAVALIFPYVLGGHRTGTSGLAMKIIGLPAFAALTLLFVSRAETYVEMKDVSEGKSVVMDVARNNAIGGSTYGDSLASRLTLAPFLLIRPLPFEVHSLQAAFASLEGMGLLVLFWRRRKALYGTLRNIRSNSFAMFLVLYAVEFTIIYAAATTNFGLLNRQRVMLIPFAIMLFLGDSRPEQRVLTVSMRILNRRRPLAVARVRSPVSRLD